MKGCDKRMRSMRDLHPEGMLVMGKGRSGKEGTMSVEIAAPGMSSSDHKVVDGSVMMCGWSGGVDVSWVVSGGLEGC